MAELDKSLPSGENVQSTIAGEDDGVDGEIDDIEENEENKGATKVAHDGGSSTVNRDTGNKDSRKRTSSDRRRHHRHHHSRSHRDRRRRSGGSNDIDSEHYLSEEDSRIGVGRSKLRSEAGQSGTDFATLDKTSRFLPKKHDRGHSRHLHVNHSQQRPKQNVDISNNGELLESHEDPLLQTKQVNVSKRLSRDKKGKHQLQTSLQAEEGEAEDGEILEDGELNDDDDDEVVEGRSGEDKNKDNTEGYPFKPSNKEDDRAEKHSRKRSEHREKRKRESDDKIKRKKHISSNKLEDESSPAPAWGSGYQGLKPKASPFHSKQAQFGRGSKDYHSPPGLYDSPSYSEESGEEAMSKTPITEGYIDASNADEKEGIFNLKASKKKKSSSERNDRKRGRTLEGKSEGPLRKKPHMAATERPVCKFYMDGKCVKGSGCLFSHDVEKPRKMEVCKYHLTVKGCIKQRCLYMHEDFPCKYYHTGAKCYSGDRCKFSHDALTEDTRRALEMRVAAEDIIDMEDPDNDREFRQRESHGRPSLLGSPPRFRQEVKKIPSLFEIEVHPPGQSPKPSPQAVSRPSGFYNEPTISPKPGVGLNANGPANSPGIGIINSSVPLNQQLLANQGNIGGPGLLQTPLRPGNLIGGPMNNNRPALMMGGTQQGMNLQQQRATGGTSVQFLGPTQMNNSQQQGGNLPPVLNMLGAIIREAAMQKGPGSSSSGIVPNSILQNMTNLGKGMNIMSSNTVPKGNMGIGPNSMGNMLPNNMRNIQPSNTNSAGPLPNMMGPNNIGSNLGANLGPNGVMGNLDQNNAFLNDNLGSTAVTNLQGVEEVGIMDVDYRIKPEFRELDESNKDLCELDIIRQRIQAQIDEEDEEGHGETDCTVKDEDDNQTQKKEEQHDSMKDKGHLEEEDQKDEKVKLEVAAEIEMMEIPPDLPKKQRELFMRIQQQQLLREKERKKQEAQKNTESEIKAEDDDWYSSDEEADSGEKPKLTDVLKKINQKPSETSSDTSTTDLFNAGSAGSSNSSAFNIIQMINAIKSHTASKPPGNVGSPFLAADSISSPPDSEQCKEVFLSSPASPPAVAASLKNAVETHHPATSGLHVPELSVDPPVVSAHPVKPLVYSVVKISLNVPKPYTLLPDGVNASDQTFKDDPRVKWHLGYLEKQMQQAPQRRESSDGDKAQKQTDPRLKKGLSDPRLTKPTDSSNANRGDGKITDPRLQRTQAQLRPTDPRLVRQVAGNLDPRLSRQNSQNNPDGSFVGGIVSNMGGGPVIMGAMSGQMGAMVNQMGGCLNNSLVPSLLNNLVPLNNIGSALNISGQINSQMSGAGRSVQGIAGPAVGHMNMIGNPVNNIGGPLNQIGPGVNQMNRMGGPLGNGNSIIGPGNGNPVGNIRGPLIQQNLLGNDSTVLDPRLNNLSGPRAGFQRVPNDSWIGNDPRLKNRLMDPREQKIFTKDSYDDGLNEPWSNNYRAAQNNLRGHDDIRQNQNFFPDGPSFRVNQTREEWTNNSERRMDGNESFQPSSSPTQYSDSEEKPMRKFDHRNDPRFKRVKRLAGQQQSNMEYNAPLNVEDCQGNTGDGEDTNYIGYSLPKLSSVQNTRTRNAPSPSLPDTLQDFDHPNSSTVNAPDLDLKVKDHFKTIDPTASPFC